MTIHLCTTGKDSIDLIPKSEVDISYIWNLLSRWISDKREKRLTFEIPSGDNKIIDVHTSDSIEYLWLRLTSFLYEYFPKESKLVIKQIKE